MKVSDIRRLAKHPISEKAQLVLNYLEKTAYELSAPVVWGDEDGPFGEHTYVYRGTVRENDEDGHSAIGAVHLWLYGEDVSIRDGRPAMCVMYSTLKDSELVDKALALREELLENEFPILEWPSFSELMKTKEQVKIEQVNREKILRAYARNKNK